MEDKLIVKQNFFKQLCLTFAGILMFLGSIFIIFVKDSIPDEVKIIGILAAGIGVLFFGVATIFIIKRLIFPKPILIVSSEGFIDNCSLISNGQMICWNEVEDIKITSVVTEKFIYVKLRDNDKYIKELSFIKKALFNINLKVSSYAININLNSSNMKLEDAYEKMNEYWMESKKTR